MLLVFVGVDDGKKCKLVYLFVDCGVMLRWYDDDVFVLYINICKDFVEIEVLKINVLFKLFWKCFFFLILFIGISFWRGKVYKERKLLLLDVLLELEMLWFCKDFLFILFINGWNEKIYLMLLKVLFIVVYLKMKKKYKIGGNMNVKVGVDCFLFLSEKRCRK